LDILGFDACLMGNWEAANALQGFATHYLASEKLEPAAGWDYRGLAELVANPAVSWWVG
jgi:hypothetical protein